MASIFENAGKLCVDACAFCKWCFPATAIACYELEETTVGAASNLSHCFAALLVLKSSLLACFSP
jgi:hypothetical protein